MNKSDLISSVAKASGLTKADAERAIDATFQSITKSLKKKNVKINETIVHETSEI